MIDIQIDEKACVGCEICVDACPTKVFAFDQPRRVPQAQKPAQCFGCLACAEQCPASAIHHEGVLYSSDFYHNPYALHIVSKLTGNGSNGHEPRAGAPSIHHAIDDLGVRLLSLAAVLRSTLSSGLPAVGSFAGRTLAGQLPRYRVPESFDDVLVLAKEQFAPAWKLNFAVDGDTLRIDIGDCFIRELCAKEKLDLGGDLCTLFYNYLAGYLNRMGKVRLRLGSANRGAETCSYEAKINA